MAIFKSYYLGSMPIDIRSINMCTYVTPVIFAIPHDRVYEIKVIVIVIVIDDGDMVPSGLRIK